MSTNDYWVKQEVDTPLFEDLVWSRPENKSFAGKLLIVGGNLHGFAAPAQAYASAQKAGIGTSRILLPDALKAAAGPVLEHGEYAPSTPSGSLNVRALDQLIQGTLWADGVLIAGDLGRNSETALLLEKYMLKCGQALIALTKDAIDYFSSNPTMLFSRDHTLLVVSFAQLQKFASKLGYPTAFTFDMGLVQLAQALNHVTLQYKAGIIVKHLQHIYVAYNGHVSTTKLQHDVDVWRVEYAARATTWAVQNPSKLFEALTSSIIM